MAVVVIDPGHGGAVKIGGSSPNNATSPSGLLEKDLTLAAARHAETALIARGHTVRLTRTADVNLGLADRARVTKAAQADVLVSIHFNGFGDPTVQGTETWVHLSSSSRSHDLAGCVQRAVLQATQHRDRGVQAKVLGVLDAAHLAPQTAACLAELSFITTTAEDLRLHDPAYLQALGEGVASGIQAFVERPTVRRVAAAAAPAARAARAMLTREGRPDPIEHVVVLMLENRSFDHMLGSLKAQFSDLEGIDPAAPGVNRDLTDGNRRYEQRPTSTTALAKDPKHELTNTLAQLTVDGANGGFVTDFRLAYQSDPALTQEVMGYYEYGALPVLHALARQFTICDHWFSSVPGPTWTNRLFVHSGTSLGRVEMPDLPFDWNLHRYDQDTIYDRLNDADVPWRIYYGDTPQSLVLTHQWAPKNASNYRRMSRFFDKARGPAEDFPAYAFIEPSYFIDQNDQHPPSNVMRGEALLARVFNALRANEALWATTLLVVLYDEHGGFYDHVPPPTSIPPDGHHDEYTFDRYGVRVPALLISPWVPAGPLDTTFDHTSLLKYLADKWRLAPLGARAAVANSFAGVFLPQMRTNTPEQMLEPAIPSVAASLAVPVREPPLNDFQRGLLAMTEVLEAQTHQDVAVTAARQVRAMDGPQASAAVALDRVERFLQQQREHADGARAIVPAVTPRVLPALRGPIAVVREAITPAAAAVGAKNPVLADVRQALDAVPTRGTKAKYAGPVKSDGDGNSHIQGLAGYKDFFLVTHSDKSEAAGRILVVDRRPAQRKLVTEFRLPSLGTGGQALNHAGGCQVIGDVLAVPSESGQNSSVVAFFDVSDPLNIRELQSSLRIPRMGRDAAAAGITTITRNGQDVWLCAVYDSGSVDFYESPDLPGGVPFQVLFQVPIKVEEKDHQGLLLFADRNNRVFAAGLNRGNFPFFDRLVLYEVDLVGQSMTPDPERSYSTGGGTRLRWGAALELVGNGLVLHCTERNYGTSCDINTFATAPSPPSRAVARGLARRKRTSGKKASAQKAAKRTAKKVAKKEPKAPEKGTAKRSTKQARKRKRSSVRL